jgi:alpha-ketoglutarate-dependent taurine dioxygenase
MVDIYKQELSNEMKHILSKLTAEHLMKNTFKPSMNSSPTHIDKYMKAIENNPSGTHPVICEHPHTQEKYLYVNGSSTTKINQLNQEESDLEGEGAGKERHFACLLCLFVKS